MKKLISLAICCSLLLSFVFISHAEDNIIESPDIKVVIDGKAGTYTDVPIIANGRTLLPLRALLVNLGVQNDDLHIIWNSLDSSVTINKETKKIYLKIGSSKAFVNGTEVLLDVAPVIYKSKTYIPAKFVAQSLGKKVIWDGSTRAVLIRDEVEFNRIKEILGKSQTAMESIDKCKFNMVIAAASGNDSMKMNMNIDVAADIDKAKKKMSLNMKMNFLGIDINTDSYFADNISYSKNPLTGEWEKETLSKAEYDKAFADNEDTNLLYTTDPLCAGLNVVESRNTDEILLRGDVFLNELFNKAGNNVNTENEKFKRFNLEISINKNTYMTNSILLEVESQSTENESQTDTNVKFTCTYSDYNGNFEITVPKEAIDNAVEKLDSTKPQDF